MSDLRWVETTPEDLPLVQLQPEQIGEDVRDGMAMWDPEVLRVHARTLLAGERPLAVVGVVPMWEGVAAAWGLLSLESLKHTPHLARGTRMWLKTRFEAPYDFKRVHTTCHVHHLKAIRFLEWLDFVCEGLMKRYGPDGSDHLLFARLRH